MLQVGKQDELINAHQSDTIAQPIQFEYVNGEVELKSQSASEPATRDSLLASVGPMEAVYINGFCASTNAPSNGEYFLKGKTKSGAPFYKLKFPAESNEYLYFDPSCDGGTAPPRWVFARGEPDKYRTNDLDSDGKCSYQARADWGSASMPPMRQIWTVWCNPWANITLVFIEPTTTTTTV